MWVKNITNFGRICNLNFPWFRINFQKYISGGQIGGFLIPQSKINHLIAYLLYTKQKQNILNALETGSGVHLKLTKTHQGNGFGTILARLGMLLAIEAINW